VVATLEVYVFHSDSLKKLVEGDWHDYEVFALRGVVEGKGVVLLDG